ncbi:SpoIIE family protein phosphatase [Streptomyces wuyuanensis]|uniref:PAS domain-containing protein n=1 Tax=Streptomyces wuyuanensis TaxID=1196353 RepID=A0A1H0A728_9ACTN|nr:SpoIIE family protein phosphatase [Streptomyces wuyuanensis]SDN29187.1 PAS domain-containing protein [Streptomyces wuyuanensis]
MERLPTSPGEHPGTAQPPPAPAGDRPGLTQPPPTIPGDRPDAAGSAPARPLPSPATAVISEQGVVTGWSEGARRLLGYAPAEIMGRPAARLLAHDADPVAPPAAPWPADLAGTLALRHRDGHDLTLPLHATRRTTTSGVTEWLVTSTAGADDDAGTGVAPQDRAPGTRTAEGGTPVVEAPGPGTPAGGTPLPGLVTDVTLGAWAFAQSPCLLAVFDTELRLLRANSAMERALSLPQARMRGLRLTDISPDPVSEETERTMGLVLRSGRPQHTPTALRPTGNSSEAGRPATVTALTDDDGGIRAVCLAVHAPDEEPDHNLTRQRMLREDPGAGIGTTLDLERTAQELTDAAVPRLADAAAVDLCETPRHSRPTGPLPLRRTAYRSHPPGTPPSGGEEPVTHPAHSPLTRCLTTGRSAVYRMDDPSLGQWRATDPEAARLDQAGTHTLMAVPMLTAGSTLGVALFTRHRNPQPFTPDDLQLAEQLTHRAATGIHNARRYTRERTTTMALQRSLLPHTLPDQPALDIATRYLPAGTEAGVGGDWFDVIPLSGARVALVVGDVVGHGIRASATMGRLRTAVRTLADVDLPPDELLTRLDDLVLHLSTDESSTSTDVTTGIGTTCLYAIYDPISRELTHARAGHPPPAAATPDGNVYFLDTPAGPPLGLGGLPFETTTTTLDEGTLLAFYTNGLLNPRETDIDQTLDTLFTALARPTPDLETTCDRILTTLLTHPPTDDIALLIARTKALQPQHVATWTLPHDPAVVTEARHRTTEQLTGWGLVEAVFITELIVSELVTNAIRYGKPPIQLRLIHTDTTLTTEVTDYSSTSPHLRHAHTYDENGRGLYLIAQLTQRWGTRHTPTSKTIWTEQTLM